MARLAAVQRESLASRDQRGWARVSTARPAWLERGEAEGGMRPAMVRDLSASGLRLHTAAPEPVGAQLEVHIQPKTSARRGSAGVILGRVVRCDSAAEDGFCLGLEIRGRRPGASLRQPLPLAPPRPLLAGDGAAPSLETARRFPSKRVRRLPLVLALLLLVLTIRGCTAGVFPRYPIRGAHAHATAREGDARWVPRDDLALYDQGADEPGIASAAGDFWRDLAQVQALLAAGAAPEAQSLAGALVRRSGGPATGLFIAGMAVAESQAARGEGGRAITTLTKLLRTQPAAPGPWRDAAAALRHVLVHEPGAASTLSPLRAALELSRERPGADAPSLLEEPITLRVHRRRHLLTIEQAGVTVRAYPVGLGFGGATPGGSYYIANKLRNPDWYDRGRTVPHGDPENPLGASWMGLGDSGKATSHGIHPTDMAESVGANLSRGCVRMRPRDAEELFQRCGVGTPVEICD